MWSNPVGNPASLYPNEVRSLFDVAFRADHVVRHSIIGFDVPALDQAPPDVAYHAGFGSLYWMEGVAFRLQVRPGCHPYIPPSPPYTLPTVHPALPTPTLMLARRAPGIQAWTGRFHPRAFSMAACQP